MDSIHCIAKAASNRWLWLRHCWNLRSEVAKLASDFAASPTHCQVHEISAAKETLAAEVERLREVVVKANAEAARKSTENAEEYAKLKAKYDKRLRATETEQVEALKIELRAERDAKHLLEIEIKELKEKLRVQADTFQVAKDGNQALLRFIHTRHRLNVKFDPDTIRGVLQRADQKRINGQ